MQSRPGTSSPRARPRRTGARVVPAVVALALLVLVLLPSPAVAHVALVSSSPEDGARLEAVPGEVALTFNEEVAEPAYVVVTTPDGASLTRGAPVVNGAVVVQRLEPGSAAGAYSIAYRVASPDGHPISGELEFTVTGTATPTAQAQPLSPQPGTAALTDTGAAADAGASRGGELEGWHVGLGAALLLAAATLVLRARRRT